MLTGFFPEFAVPGYHTCETCMMADMVTLAVQLSSGGYANHWDDVDRWVRNQFVEQQLTSTDWVYKMAERQPRKPVAFNEVGEKVPERNLGGFAGWAAPNDFTKRYLGYEASFMHCCMGNGTRTLYYVWEHMLSYKNERLKVNLLMNRASDAADVYSYIPYEGKVEIKIKKTCKDLSVRAPEWVETGSANRVTLTRAGATLPTVWDGRYVRTIDSLRPGDLVTVSFAVPFQTVKTTMAGTDYTLEIRGNTVVSISPGGENGPLYQRAYMKADKAPTTKVKRFISERPILW